jgi:hypothetical protein
MSHFMRFDDGALATFSLDKNRLSDSFAFMVVGNL